MQHLNAKSDTGDSGDPKRATTFPRFVRAAAEAYADKVAIRLRGETIPDESLSFVELERRSAELARGLLGRGAGKGSRVGFIFGNGPSFGVVLAAIARIGAVAVPISTLIKADELVRVLRQSDVGGLIVQRRLLGVDYVERLCEALPELRASVEPNLRVARTPYLRWIASSGEGMPPTFRDLNWIRDAASEISEELLREVESEVHEADQMVEIYTSGSMAMPKGVKHHHGPALFRMHYVRERNAVQPDVELTATLPMFWIGGLGMHLLSAWEVGATLNCNERTVTNSQTAMGVVLADDDLARLAAAPTNWALGMSETFGPYSFGNVVRASGYPMCAPIDHVADRYEVRVADENGNPVGDGEVGEVQVRGYAVTPGLHKIERSEVFTSDGYYHTGDLGLVDGKRIHFVGRAGDMIKTAGSNVSPAEVEMELQQLPGVHSAFVFGLPDPVRGQRVVAALVPREGAQLDFGEIETQMRRRLSSFKVPRTYVTISRDDVPMLHSNKVARRQLAGSIAERLGAF